MCEKCEAKYCRLRIWSICIVRCRNVWMRDTKSFIHVYKCNTRHGRCETTCNALVVVWVIHVPAAGCCMLCLVRVKMCVNITKVIAQWVSFGRSLLLAYGFTHYKCKWSINEYKRMETMNLSIFDLSMDHNVSAKSDEIECERHNAVRGRQPKSTCFLPISLCVSRFRFTTTFIFTWQTCQSQTRFLFLHFMWFAKGALQFNDELAMIFQFSLSSCWVRSMRRLDSKNKQKNRFSETNTQRLNCIWRRKNWIGFVSAFYTFRKTKIFSPSLRKFVSIYLEFCAGIVHKLHTHTPHRTLKLSNDLSVSRFENAFQRWNIAAVVSCDTHL